MKNNDDKLVFKTISAYNDTVVELTQKKFDEHILKHHPEMKGHEKDIEQTVKEPNIIYQAKTFPEKRLHFFRRTNKNEPSKYNNVIVEYDDNKKEKAHVTTTFYSDNMGKGGGECVYFKYNNNI